MNKAPLKVIALYSHKNVVRIILLTSWFKVTLIAQPYTRGLSGKILELCTHMIGPISMEKAT